MAMLATVEGDLLLQQRQGRRLVPLGPHELRELFRDLGVPTSGDDFEQAVSELDTDRSGTVSFDEFRAWWHLGTVTYVLKRDDGVPDSDDVCRTEPGWRSSASPRKQTGRRSSLASFGGLGCLGTSGIRTSSGL